MRTAFLAALLLLHLAGCAASVPRPAAGETLARFAGTWDVAVTDVAGNPIPGHVITATADPGGWRKDFPERGGIPVRVLEASGDLVAFEAGPYESVLRPGVQVTALYLTRFSGGRSSGHLIATYAGGGEPIPPLRATTRGTRRP